jgi:hypothetical protein
VVLDAPQNSGAVVDRGWTFAESGYESPIEDDDVYPHSRFGSSVAVDGPSGALLVGAKTHNDYFDLASFALDAEALQHIVDALGTIRSSRALEGGGGVLTYGLGTIDLLRGHFIWTGTYEIIGPYALGGTVYLFDTRCWALTTSGMPAPCIVPTAATSCSSGSSRVTTSTGTVWPTW